MGRKVVRVPPHWDHPLVRNPNTGRMDYYQPMHDQTFAAAAAKWKERLAAWERGERPSYFEASGQPSDLQLWEWDDGPPSNRDYYRPWTDADATWWQLWENVSEGTPVSPPFATAEELVDYLVEHGDYWDQSRAAREVFFPGERRETGWDRAQAEALVRSGWAPTLFIQDGALVEGKHAEL